MFSIYEKLRCSIPIAIGLAISTTIFAATPKDRIEDNIEYYTSIPFEKCRQLIKETYLQSGATKSQVDISDYKYSETFATTIKAITMICYKSDKMYTKILRKTDKPLVR